MGSGSITVTGTNNVFVTDAPVLSNANVSLLKLPSGYKDDLLDAEGNDEIEDNHWRGESFKNLRELDFLFAEGGYQKKQNSDICG